MLTDPLAITYDGSAKSLPRVSGKRGRSVYRTADGEFTVEIVDGPRPKDGREGASIYLYRTLPDPTPSDVFNDYRVIRNGFGLTFLTDSTRAESSVDLPRLRTALDSFVNATMMNRLIAGEK